jgi:serine/threonine-protein kinase
MASVHQRYRILDKIDAGGMAEIYRGMAVAIEGFEKPVAIKRILPSLTADRKFVGMFLDEARLSMQLTHANIVQIFDIGKADDTFFIVMELVEGSNLRRLMSRASDQGIEFPVPLACYLAMEIAKALAYAHERKDSAGEPLGIVHRDVSPPNVLLSRQGEVKLTDFGLAKANTQAERTEAGVIKGKYAYLSPEVVEGKEVDPRADIYSCGIILWEMLCDRKLFAGKTDMDTIELVRKGDVDAPSTHRSDVDPALDKIILRALAKQPRRRYQTARQFEQALAGYLFNHGKRVTASDVAAFLAEVTGRTADDAVGLDVSEAIRAELEALQRAGRIDLARGQAPLRADALRSSAHGRLPVGPMLCRLPELPLDELGGTEGGLQTLAERLEGQPADAEQATDGAGPSRAVRLIVGILSAAAVGAVVAWQLGLIP